MTRVQRNHHRLFDHQVLPAGLMLVLGVVAAACTDQPSSDSADAESSELHAFVTIERWSDALDGNAKRVLAEVRFAKTQRSVEPALVGKLLGNTIDVPNAGQCERLGVTKDDPAVALHALPPIELLDAGGVELESVDGPRVALAERAYPDVAHLVSGVVYTSRQASTELGATGPVRLVVNGSSDVVPFSAWVDVPDPLDNVLVSGAPLGEFLADDFASDLEISWSGGGDDTVMVEVEPVGAVGGTRWRCTAVSGQAHVVVPASAFGPAGAFVALHRVVDRSFETRSVTSVRANVDSVLTGVVRRGAAEPAGG